MKTFGVMIRLSPEELLEVEAFVDATKRKLDPAARLSAAALAKGVLLAYVRGELVRQKGGSG